MVADNVLICPKCNGDLKYYDRVQRAVRTKGGLLNYLEIRRLKCLKCGSIHRELPDDIFPYKQYEAEIIRGVLEDFITFETLGYEDYPCATTMSRWITQKMQILRWNG